MVPLAEGRFDLSSDVARNVSPARTALRQRTASHCTPQTQAMAPFVS